MSRRRPGQVVDAAGEPVVSATTRPPGSSLLGTPIRVGGMSYNVASNPWARDVAAHERDARLGRVRLRLRTAATGELVSVAASLVSATGELVTVQALDAPSQTPVGLYRVFSLALERTGPSDRVWKYTFNRGTVATVGPLTARCRVPVR